MRTIFRLLLLMAIAIPVATLSRSPVAHAGFYCPTVRSIPLKPADPTVPVTLTRGIAEIDECYGLSFLRVRVFGAVPDGTAYVVALPGLEPILGDFFSMMRNRGDSLLPDIAAATVSGRTVTVNDEGFTTVLIGQF